MKRILSLVIACFALTVQAQTPAAFVGLLTSQTDLTGLPAWATDDWFTSNGAGVPGNNLGPLYNGNKFDSIFGTTSYRPPIPTDCPAAHGACSAYNPGWTVDYSKIIPQSRDGSLMLFPDPSGWDQLWSCTTTNPVSCTYLRRIQIDSVTNAFAVDATDFIGDNSNWTFCQNTSTANCNNLIYYTGRKTNSSGINELKVYNASTNTSSVVFDFSTILAGYPGANSIDDFREGNPSEDDRYWFLCATDGGGTTFGCFIYDRTANAVIANKSVAANGICGTQSCNAAGGFTNNFANWTGVCGDGTTDYFLINMNNVASRPWTTTRGTGTWVYDINLNALGFADYANSHADCGRDKSGNWTYITVPFETFHFDAAAVAVVNLASVSITPPATNNPQWSGMVENGIPCLWSFLDTGCITNRPGGQAYTISMRGSHGSQQGAMVFANFYPPGGPTGSSLTGSGGWGALENDIVMVNWNTGVVPGTGTAAPIGALYRLNRTHAINSEYFTQADGVCNWDCTRLFYTSSGDINNGPTPAQMASNMLPTSPFLQTYHMPLVVSLPIGGAAPPAATFKGNFKLLGNANTKLQ